jgi:hypothetical protein
LVRGAFCGLGDRVAYLDERRANIGYGVRLRADPRSKPGSLNLDRSRHAKADRRSATSRAVALTTELQGENSKYVIAEAENGDLIGIAGA